MLEARIGQAEMVEPMIEDLAGDHHAEIVGHGEIRQPDPAGFMDLAKNDFLFRAMNGAPGSDPALQRPADSRPELGMAPDHLLENGNDTKAGDRLEHWHDLDIPDRAQRIRAAPLSRRLARRG